MEYSEYSHGVLRVLTQGALSTHTGYPRGLRVPHPALCARSYPKTNRFVAFDGRYVHRVLRVLTRVL